MLSVVPDDAAQAALRLELDELFREGARRMLAVALEAEVEAYIAAHAELLDEHGPWGARSQFLGFGGGVIAGRCGLPHRDRARTGRPSLMELGPGGRASAVSGLLAGVGHPQQPDAMTQNAGRDRHTIDSWRQPLQPKGAQWPVTQGLWRRRRGRVARAPAQSGTP
jgi:hypothetical protein